MSFRAIYIIPAKEDAEIPLFSKYFNTVEIRCKSLLGVSYVKIPSEKEFLKLLFTEIGIQNGGRFCKLRDDCAKVFAKPAFQLETKSGVLWPVIVTEYEAFIYCAVIFDENFKIKHQPSNVNLTFMGHVATTLEALNGIACYVDRGSRVQGKPDTNELRKYINSTMPFGRVFCSDASLALEFSSSVFKGKSKQPTWNPLRTKGKANVSILIKEQILSIQFNQENVCDVFGSISCSAEAEGLLPEVSFVLSTSCENKCGLLVNANVINVENISPTSIRVRSHPVKIQNLCIYKVNGARLPPILGTFSMKLVDDIAHIVLNLKLQKGVKNVFQTLQVHIPCNYVISMVKSLCSQGSLSVSSKNILVWNVGTKFPPKTLEISLQARLKLRISKYDEASELTSEEQLHSENFTQFCFNPEETVKSLNAFVHFTIDSYTHSGCNVDSRSIVVSSSTKVNCSVYTECCSGVYEIWNNENNLNSNVCPQLEEFSTVVQSNI